MRLDEWQKYIESQFLVEAEPAAKPANPAAAPSAPNLQTSLLLDEEPITLPAELDAISDAEPPNTGSEVPNGATQAEAVTAAEAEPPAARQAPVERHTPVTTPRQSGFVVRSVIELPAERPEPLPAVSPIPFASSLEIEPAIPDFADYLPSKSTAEESTPNESDVVARLLESESAPAPMSVLVPMTSGFTSPLSAPSPAAAGSESDGAAIRRRKRAPQARNVQPETVPSVLSSADLWAKVPRHVQTLLALERREEEREVAQSSYKRPFQEKRAELIARILDPVLSLEDTARLLNVCPTTVRRYTNKGILTHYRKEPDQRNGAERPAGGASERETRQRRFRLSDILAFLETQQAALEADRLQERVAPSRRKRDVSSIEVTQSE